MNSGIYILTWRQLEALIPPLAGLAIIKGLRIQGWGALLAYLVADGGIRGLMKQVDSQGESLAKNEINSSKQSKNPKINPERPNLSWGYQVVHQIPGRIRLKIPSLKTEPQWAQKLEELVNFEDRITKVRVNRNAVSVVIHYRTEIDSKSRKLPLESQELMDLIQWVCGEQLESKDGYRSQNTSLKEILEDGNPIALTDISSDSVESNSILDGCSPQQETTEFIETETREINPIQHSPAEYQEMELDLPSPWETENEEPTLTIPQTISTQPTSAEEDCEESSYFKRLKGSMLTVLLKIMGNLPVSQTEVKQI